MVQGTLALPEKLHSELISAAEFSHPIKMENALNKFKKEEGDWKWLIDKLELLSADYEYDEIVKLVEQIKTKK